METKIERASICIDEGVLVFVNIVSFTFSVGNLSLGTMKGLGIRNLKGAFRIRCYRSDCPKHHEEHLLRGKEHLQ